MKKSIIKVCSPLLAACMFTACAANVDATESVNGNALFADAETTPATTIVETEETTVETEETTVETEELEPIIGVKSDKALTVNLMNMTNADITGIAIKVNDKEYSGNLLKDTFYADEDRVFYYDNSNDPENSVYTLKITFKSGFEDYLHNFDFDAFVGADIFVENNQVFLKYKSVTGDVSTYEAEYAIDYPNGEPEVTTAATTAAPVVTQATTAATTARPTAATTAATTATPTTAAPTQATTQATVAPTQDQGCIGDDALFY